MSTPEAAKLVIDDATAEFPAIAGAPSDDDIKTLTEFLQNLLQAIDIPGGRDSLSGLIDAPSDYRAAYGHDFDRLETPLSSYDPSIATDATNAVRVKAERAWTAQLELQRLIRTVERTLRSFFSTIIEDTWLLPLKDPVTFYNKVPLREYLRHLSASSGGLEATDIVQLQASMLTWWSEDPRVPEYINKLDDAQKKASRAQLPITDEWLAAIATMSLLSAGSFPKLHLDWDGLAPAAKTWTAWKTWALKSQKTTEREQRASGIRGDVFGSAASAIQAHGTTADPHNLLPSTYDPTAQPVLAELDRYLDNMAAAVTNEKAVLETLVSTNAELSKLSSTKIAKLEKLLQDLKSSGPRPAQGTTPSASHTNADTRAVAQLRAAIKHKWIPGSFCSSHGWGVGPNHSSSNCKGKRAGHVDSATRANPQGPGATRNKGWDDFLSE
jgi:hypothetical protein